jgi:hypothetical protein
MFDVALALLAFLATGSTGRMVLVGLQSGVLPGQRSAGDLAHRAGDPRRFRRYLLFYAVGFAASLFFLGHQLLELWRHAQS